MLRHDFPGFLDSLIFEPYSSLSHVWMNKSLREQVKRDINHSWSPLLLKSAIAWSLIHGCGTAHHTIEVGPQ